MISNAQSITNSPFGRWACKKEEITLIKLDFEYQNVLEYMRPDINSDKYCLFEYDEKGYFNFRKDIWILERIFEY